MSYIYIVYIYIYTLLVGTAQRLVVTWSLAAAVMLGGSKTYDLLSSC